MLNFKRITAAQTPIDTFYWIRWKFPSFLLFLRNFKDKTKKSPQYCIQIVYRTIKYSKRIYEDYRGKIKMWNWSSHVCCIISQFSTCVLFHWKLPQTLFCIFIHMFSEELLHLGKAFVSTVSSIISVIVGNTEIWCCCNENIFMWAMWHSSSSLVSHLHII